MTTTVGYVDVKPKRKSYKTLYLNEVKNHKITRDFHEKLLKEIREIHDSELQQRSWGYWFKSFFSA